MPQPPLEKPLIDHVTSAHLGYNDKDEPHLLPDNSVALIENMRIHNFGARTRRNGVDDIGGMTLNPNGLWSAYDQVLDQKSLFATYGGRVFITPEAGVIQERASGISLTDTRHKAVQGYFGGRPCSFIYQDCKNDSNSTLTSHLAVITDNNSWTQASIAPRAVCWFQNRLWVGRSAYGGQSYETVWWSELGDGLSYSANNTLQIEPGTGGDITALLPMRGFQPLIVVFKETAVATLEPSWGTNSSLIPAAADALDTIKTRIRLISNVVGCIAPSSIQNVPGAPGGDIYFLAKDGVRALTRANDDTISGVSKPITEPIKSTIARINFAYANKCVSTVYDNHYWLAVPLDGATENNYILFCNLDNGGWAVDTLAPKELVTAQMYSNTREELWAQYNSLTADCSVTGAETSYHIFQLNAGVYDPGGVVIPFKEESKGFSFGDITVKKKWDWMALAFHNNTTDTCTFGIQYNVDGRGWTTAASLVAGPVSATLDPVMGETPLPWGYQAGVNRVFKFALNDAPPGYEIQLRYFGISDISKPVIIDMAVAARPVYREFDNSIG